MSKDTLQILEDARALVADENTWIRGDEHKQKDITVEIGRSFLFGPRTKTTTVDQYCVIGALKAAAEDEYFNSYEARQAVELVASLIKTSSFKFSTPYYVIPRWNDCSATHDSVLKVFDRAIQAEKDRRINELRAEALKQEQLDKEEADRRLRELLDSIPEPEVEHAPVDAKVFVEV